MLIEFTSRRINNKFCSVLFSVLACVSSENGIALSKLLPKISIELKQRFLRKGRAGVTLQMEHRTHVKPTSSNDTIKQMTSTWRSKINAYNIIQRNLIRQIYKYTIKKYIQIHNKECTEISPRDSCFAPLSYCLGISMCCIFAAQ